MKAYDGDRAQPHIAGDCTGTTWYIYHNAGFPYKYKHTPFFAPQSKGTAQDICTTFLFRRFSDQSERQVGDIAHCSNYPHVVIVGNFSSVTNLTFTIPHERTENEPEGSSEIVRSADRKAYALTISSPSIKLNSVFWTASSSKSSYITDVEKTFTIDAYYRYQKVVGTKVANRTVENKK